MVRRWSHIKPINTNLFSLNFFENKYKVINFRSLVNFKKYFLKLTKFKRKSIMRIKHKTNFLIYTNILKFWVKDFIFYKKYLKHQFMFNLFINNYYVYNFNYFKIQGEAGFYNFNFFISLLTKKINNHFFLNFDNFNKNNNISLVWASNYPDFDNSVIPSFSLWDHHLYSNSINRNFTKNFDINNLFLSIFDTNLQQISSIRTLLILLYINKFLNVKYFCF